MKILRSIFWLLCAVVGLGMIVLAFLRSNHNPIGISENLLAAAATACLFGGIYLLIKSIIRILEIFSGRR